MDGVAVIDVNAAGIPADALQRDFDNAADEVMRTVDPPLCAISIQTGEISSRMLGAIMHFRSRAEERGGALALYGLRARTRQIITVLNHDRVIKHVPTLPDAIKALKGGR